MENVFKRTHIQIQPSTNQSTIDELHFNINQKKTLTEAPQTENKKRSFSFCYCYIPYSFPHFNLLQLATFSEFSLSFLLPGFLLLSFAFFLSTNFFFFTTKKKIARGLFISNMGQWKNCWWLDIVSRKPIRAYTKHWIYSTITLFFIVR